MQPAASRVGLRPVKACLVAARPAISDWAQDTGSTSTKEPERLVASGLRRRKMSTLLGQLMLGFVEFGSAGGLLIQAAAGRACGTGWWRTGLIGSQRTADFDGSRCF